MKTSTEESVLAAAAKLHQKLGRILEEFGISPENGEAVVSTLLHVLEKNAKTGLSDT